MYRYPTSRCKTLPELEDRLRELVHQLEPVVLRNVYVGTTETAVAHGLREVPGWVGWDMPHCIAIVKQTKDPDQNCVYLKATNACVVNVKVVRAGPFTPSSGHYEYADWDPTSGYVPYTGYDFVFCTPGLTSSGAILAAWPVIRATTLPAGLTGSYCKVVGVLPTAAVTITIKLLHSGSLTSVAAAGISGGTSDGSFTATSPIVMVAGDFLIFYNQTPADATMTGLSIGLKGARV